MESVMCFVPQFANNGSLRPKELMMEVQIQKREVFIL